MSKPIAIVLGGTAPHVSLVNKLHERGYYVVLVDYLTNPPAEMVAEEHIQASTLDKEKVLEIAKKERPDLIVLQSRSPSCGVNTIYDGSFTGKLKSGSGVTAELLIKNGIEL